MIRATTFAGRRVAVFGLARSGIAAAQSLAAGGAVVACWDDREAGRTAAAAAGLPLVPLDRAAWGDFAALVLSPGVPLTHPEPHWTVRRAAAAGVEVIGDTELFFRERAAVAPGAPVVAITGTNGKSTTTALLTHLLRATGADVQMGGNIGVGVLALEPFAAGRIHVLEMSSFQIDLTPTLRPTVGITLNVAPDHLDRHGTMERYAAIKRRMATQADRAVVGIDDDWCRAIAEDVRRSGRSLSTVSIRGEADIWAVGSTLIVRRPPFHADLAGITSLRGAHNAQNAAAAIAAVASLGIEPSSVLHALATFPGLPHRMEQVGRIGKALIINDSKATNADSTEKALASFPGDIYWILGGTPKEGGITCLAHYFPRISKAYLIGLAAGDFAKTLEGRVEFEMSQTLEVALANAVRDAAAGSAQHPIVLLSPACASYDQFKSFEHRGDRFRDLARRMPGFATGNAS
jgi:UDP-N-acetylmuramoylalanine--D-glutamate ligase